MCIFDRVINKLHLAGTCEWNRYRHFHFEALGCSNVGDAWVVRHAEILLSPLGCLAFAETRRGRPCFFGNRKMGFLCKNQECKCSLEPNRKQIDMFCIWRNIQIQIYIELYLYAIYVYMRQDTCCFSKKHLFSGSLEFLPCFRSLHPTERLHLWCGAQRYLGELEMFGVEIHASEVCILQLCSDLGMISNLYKFIGIEYQVKVSIGCHGSLLCNYFIMLDVNWFDGSEK